MLCNFLFCMGKKKLQVWLPLMFAVVMTIGMFIGYQLREKTTGGDSFLKNNIRTPLQEIITLIESRYVDKINDDSLKGQVIDDVLGELDPHSIFIPARDLATVNEDLEGNFQGIGVEFQIYKDTVNVMNVVEDGPSAKAGVQIGDKIIKVNDTALIAGVKVNTERVRSLLRGPNGSDVTITVLRDKNQKKIKIERGFIPLFSLDAAYMLDSSTGYIKLNKFAETTYREFMQAMEKLQKQNMQKLVLDLRGNGGGILQQAVNIADEFLNDDKLVVYTQGNTIPRTDYKCSKDGVFEKGKLAVLIDETSASASEILAGALQDWDRATIIGRRSFGKGLVQQQFQLNDGSALRLTVARYYTPLGRNIQKPYNKGRDAYEEDLVARLHNGELLHADTTKPTTIPYKTPNGHLVYGGGGITPDDFVPIDTSYETREIALVYNKGTLNNFVYNYYLKNKAELSKFKSPQDFNNGFTVGDAQWQQLSSFALQDSVKLNTASASTRNYILLRTKALLARELWRTNGYYMVVNTSDAAIKKALEEMN